MLVACSAAGRRPRYEVEFRLITDPSTVQRRTSSSPGAVFGSLVHTTDQ